MGKLFVYGTLRSTKVQNEVFGREAKMVADALHGYAVTNVEIEGEQYPVLIPQENGRVEELVITVAENELQTIDEYETNAYERKKVILESGTEAWVYVQSTILQRRSG